MSISAQTSRRRSYRSQLTRTGFAGLVALVVAGFVTLAAVVLAGQAARRGSVEDIRRQAEATLVLDRALLASELDRHRATPVVLGTEDAIAEALRDPDPGRLSRVNARLEMLAIQTGAAAIYLLDAKGKAIAANNYRTAVSFVGADFAYRPYFQTAMQTGADEYFAQGLRSQRPGLFLSRRIGTASDALGVIVVKVELSAIEAAWRRQSGQAMVADRNGVILLTSDPDRRFRVLTPLEPAKVLALRSNGQFGNARLTPLTPPPGRQGRRHCSGRRAGLCPVCGSAWKRDPVSGVIGVE